MADEKVVPDVPASADEQIGFLSSVLNEIVNSPLNLVLVGVITFLVYKIFRSQKQPAAGPPPEPELPRLRKDFTVAELLQYDGKQPDGRVLVAVNGTVYDATKGKRFYGPGGPYAAFGGRDASRGLATFSVISTDKEEYDDLSDLTPMEMESIREWEMQFKEKYILVGRLLKPGEQPTNYSDEDEDTPTESTPTGGESKVATSSNKDDMTAPAAAAPSSPKKKADSSSGDDSKPESTPSAAADASAKTEATSKAEDLKSGGDPKGKDE